jgi:predicted nicotinamide N-methyase
MTPRVVPRRIFFTLRCLAIMAALTTEPALCDCKKPVRTHVSSDGQKYEYHPCKKQWVVLATELSPGGENAAATKVLSLPGRLFNFNFSSGEFKINDLPLRISAPGSFRNAEDQEDADTGLTIWDGSVLLAKYLEHLSRSPNGNSLKGSRVVELGSGVGLVGISCGALGANVFLTDLPYCIPTLEKNIQRTIAQTEWGEAQAKDGLADAQTIPGSMAAAPLDWTDFANNTVLTTKIDWVVGADIVWLEPLIPPLVRLLHAIAVQNKGCKFLIAYQSRSKRADEILYDELRAKSFHVGTVDRERMPEGYRTDRLDILELKHDPSR